MQIQGNGIQLFFDVAHTLMSVVPNYEVHPRSFLATVWAAEHR
jgi:hypothetical protein